MADMKTLPSFFPSQVGIVSAFSDYGISRSLTGSIIYGSAFLGTSNVYLLSADEDEKCCFKIIAVKDQYKLHIVIQRSKTIAQGSFIDAETFRNRMLVSIINRISKNPRGKKFISYAQVSFDSENSHYKWSDMVCIDEYVIF